MAKHELKSLKAWLSRLLPCVSSREQMTALFTVAMLLALSHAEFDAPHVHVESTSVDVPIASVMVSNTASGTMSYHWTPYNPYGR